VHQSPQLCRAVVQHPAYSIAHHRCVLSQPSSWLHHQHLMHPADLPGPLSNKPADIRLPSQVITIQTRFTCPGLNYLGPWQAPPCLYGMQTAQPILSLRDQLNSQDPGLSTYTENSYDRSERPHCLPEARVQLDLLQPELGVTVGQGARQVGAHTLQGT
jgi:hypothetical protein